MSASNPQTPTLAPVAGRTASSHPSAATVRFVEQWLWESPYRETWGEAWSAPHVRDAARMIEDALRAMPPNAASANRPGYQHL